MSYVVWDLETETHALNKRKASPWHPDANVVASGWKRKGGKCEYIYAGKQRMVEVDTRWFTKLLTGHKMLVGFNIGFDLLHALQDPDNLAAWMDWVAEGGMVWDCQLAEYLLDGMPQESHMLSLDEVSPKYGGQLKVDAVKALWAAGVQTSDINPDLLIEYLVGKGDADGGDIGNTERVFIGQLRKARTVGQTKSIMLNMGALLCVVEMMRNGMYVDVALGMQLAEALSEQVKIKTAQLADFLPKNMPFEFKWTSRFHLSAFIFGGTVKYKAPAFVLDADGNKTYYQKDEEHYVLANGTTMPISQHDGEELLRFAGGKNKGEPKTKKVKVPDIERGAKTRIEDWDYTFPGVTTPEARWEGADKGVYSVAADVIEELEGRGIPFLELLGEVTKMRKDLTTYYITDAVEGEERKGMLTLVQADGIIHHSINMTSTVTARFSSSNPNLQNIPKGKTSDIKSVFTSRFPGGRIIQSDFSSLEVYVQAVLTQDPALIQHLREGLDMHCARLALSRGMAYEEVYRLAKVEGVKEWDEARTDIKVFSFQRAYGAGAAKIAAGLKKPKELVETWIEADKKMYPRVEEYYVEVTSAIERSRKPTSLMVQHPEIKGLTVQLGRGHYRTPDQKLYVYKESPAPKYIVERRGGKHATFSPTEIRNYIVQGTGGEVMKAAMYLMVRSFYAAKNFGGLALLVNTVHDAAYADSHPSVRDKAAALVHACMEGASDYMEWHFGWEFPVQVPSDTSDGASMMDEEKLPPVVKQLAKKYRTHLRTKYMGGYRPINIQE